MLKIRVIPTLLTKDFSTLVKGIAFDSARVVGTIVPAIKVYTTRLVDEIIVVDVIASLKNQRPDFQAVAHFARECFVPLTVGGGISSIEDISDLLRAGADKICINSLAYQDPTLIQRAAERFGSQCVVVSIDVREIKSGLYECYSHSGSKATGLLVEEWAQTVAALGAGEILLTSIDRDGTMNGFDLNLIKKVSQVVAIPVIASGGARGGEDMYRAVSEAGACAVAAASMFHFTQITPLKVKNFLADQGLPVRMLSV